MPASSPGGAIRQLTVQDIPAALVLSFAAGWNQTEADWKLLLQPDVGSCLGIESDGRIVATASLVCYGDVLGWVGMVLTHPDYRKRGLARQLVERTLGMADFRKIRCLKLDATEQGSSLYESFGFRAEQVIERWAASSLPIHGSRTLPAAIPSRALDREAFGADRSPILQYLADANPPFTTEDGFAFVRAGANARYLGPCAARSSEAARILIASSLTRMDNPTADSRWYWDLLPSNRDAAAIAREFNFQPERRLLRMIRGPVVQGNDSMIYAGGGFELG